METINTDAFKLKVFNFEKNKAWKFEGTRPAIVDFYADWCGPCRALSPILQKLAKDYEGKVDIYKIDTEASPDLAAMFQIRSIPSLLFIPVSGQPTMSAGMLPESALKETIKEVLGVT